MCKSSGVSAHEVDFKVRYPVTGQSRIHQDDIYCLYLSVRALSNQTVTYGEE